MLNLMSLCHAVLSSALLWPLLHSSGASPFLTCTGRLLLLHSIPRMPPMEKHRDSALLSTDREVIGLALLIQCSQLQKQQTNSWPPKQNTSHINPHDSHWFHPPPHGLGWVKIRPHREKLHLWDVGTFLSAVCYGALLVVFFPLCILVTKSVEKAAARKQYQEYPMIQMFLMLNKFNVSGRRLFIRGSHN